MSEWGLDPRLIASWRQAAGLDAGRATVTGHRLRARSGVATHPLLRVHAEQPDRFDSVVFLRTMTVSQILVGLYTPCVLRWEPRAIDADKPRLFVIMHAVPGAVAVRTPGRECIEPCGRTIAVRSDRVFQIERRTPGDLVVAVIPAADASGSQPGRERRSASVGQDWLTVVPTSAFLRRFVCETAVSPELMGSDAELAGIALIRASLGQETDPRGIHANPAFVRMAVRCVIDRRYTDPTLSADAIARELHMSRRHLYRHFAGCEQSVSALIAARRLGAAREALGSALTLDEVAVRSGFGSVTTLRNRFRSEYGFTPSEFREQLRSEIDPADLVDPRTAATRA